MWINHLVDIIGSKLGFKSSLVDPGVWCKVATDNTGFGYYTYILVYVDDIIVLDKTPQNYMDMLEEFFLINLSII